MKLTINGTSVVADTFAFDGCHKIYVCESADDESEAEAAGYSLLPVERLAETFEQSCPLRFVSNWGLTVHFVSQRENGKIDVRVQKMRKGVAIRVESSNGRDLVAEVSTADAVLFANVLACSPAARRVWIEGHQIAGPVDELDTVPAPAPAGA